MKRKRLSLLLLVCLLAMACNFPLFSAAPTEAVNTSTPGGAAQAADVASDTPAATATNTTSAPAAPVVPPGPSVPQASPSGQPVNCRSGPGMNFDVVIVLQVGQSAEIVGKLADGSWVLVKNPSVAGNTCWVATSVVTTTGDLSGVQVAAAPPAPPTAVVPTTSSAVVVTDVSVSVSPATIGVPGCMGPIQPSTAEAQITVNGAIKLTWYFKTDQNGTLPKHSTNFQGAGTKGVSTTFTPPLTPGTYNIQLFIDGMNLKGMDAVATYKIHC